MPDHPAALVANGAVSSADPTVELAPCLVLIAPAWFQRDDFLDWRQGKAECQWLPPATSCNLRSPDIEPPKHERLAITNFASYRRKHAENRR